jgi:beta-phosphoglucomutase-like phosphatase (HAD superfamily)
MKLPATIKGAIFDVDDTLLDNQAGASMGTIHEITRLRAIRHAAEKYSLPTLLEVTEEENLAAFNNAKQHTLEGAVWKTLFDRGVVDTDELDRENELLKEIILLKNELHKGTLRELGQPVLDAVEFVTVLAKKYGIADKMAVASTAYRQDLDIFLNEMTPLRTYFPDERVISFENVPKGFSKPHPESFNRAFATLGLPDKDRQYVVAFEDDPRGVQSAKAAGLYVCAITTRYKADDPKLVAAKPDYVIENYADAIAFLEGKAHA